jgi:predicted metal-dependent hydrolase
LEDVCTLEHLKRERMLNRLEAYLKSEEYVRNLQALLLATDTKIRSILTKLQEHQALQLFFVYIKNVLSCEERICYLKGANEKLRDFKKSLEKTLKQIAQRNEFKINNYVDHLFR